MNRHADHAAGCPLDPKHWLRHAVVAAIHLIRTDVADDDDRPFLDEISALALLTEIEQHAELDDAWATVTLRDLAVSASPIDENMQGDCTCVA